MVNFALRDHNWGTIPFEIQAERVQTNPSSFDITYQARFSQTGVDFTFVCRIAGRDDGEIVFQIEGQSSSEFLTNRAGFTVLHPLRECVGKPLTIFHADGTKEARAFPELISPHQPAKEVTGFRWPLSNGAEAEIHFAGEVFEMEDQRNWTDASFKTYCTPLSRPFPIQMKKGDRVRQEIRLKLHGVVENQLRTERDSIRISGKGFWLSFPEVGVACSSGKRGFSSEELTRLKALKLSHYRVDVNGTEADWLEQWQAKAQEASQLGIPMELALHLESAEDSLETFLDALAPHASRIASITVFVRGEKVTPAETVATHIRNLRRAFPRARIGGGTDAFFAELNRDRVETSSLDYVNFSLNPQVHASDVLSIIETLEAQPATVETAASFAGGREVHVSPVTLKMRWNPNATGPEPERPPEALPADVDLRQMSLFAAVWTLGCIKQLAESGVRLMTLFETLGEKGLMHLEEPAYPERFPAPAGSLFPVYFVLRELAGAESIQPVQSTVPLAADGLWIHKQRDVLLLANYTACRQQIELPEMFHRGALRVLDVEGAEQWSRSPGDYFQTTRDFVGDSLELDAYAMAVLESDRDEPPAR